MEEVTCSSTSGPCKVATVPKPLKLFPNYNLPEVTYVH